MRISGTLAVLAFSLAAASSSFGQVQHRGMSPEQEFLVCAQKVLGKPVLWQDIFNGPRNSNRAPKVACPTSRNEFVAALQKDEAIKVYEDEQFAFLVTTGDSPLRKPNTFYGYKFDRIPIKLNVSQGQRPGSRQLSEGEVKQITADILHNTRGVEILWGIGNPREAPCKMEDRILVLLELEARHLSKTGPESVVAFLRVTPCADDDLSPIYYSDVARMIYGEITNGAYATKWDSPLLYAPSAWVSYRDLKGDGTDEILIWPSKVGEAEHWREDDDFAYTGGAVVFDLEGHELTRGAFCSEYYAFPEERVCPMEADKLVLVPAKTGKQLDIIATGWGDDHWRGLKGNAHRLHLINQHYEPEPALVVSSKPQHTEALPAKDVGLLLGLRLGGGSATGYYDFMYGVYRTLWITRVGGNVKIDEAPNLLLPRRNGFWQVGSKISFSGDKKEEFVWLAPLGKQIPIHKLSEKEAESLPEREVMAQPIQFVTPDYIGLAKAQYEHLESVYTYKTDEPDFQHALDISTVLGPAGEKALADKIEKPQDLIGSVPVSMQGNCNLAVPPVNWGAVREQGHWSVEGWGIWTDIKCSETIPLFRTSLRAPAKVIGFDELPVTWEQITKAFPQAADAFGAPTWGLLIVLTNDELLVCPVMESGIGKPLARSPLLSGEKAVMAQWAVGKFVASWGDQFEIFKKNPGPHNEPPNN